MADKDQHQDDDNKLAEQHTINKFQTDEEVEPELLPKGSLREQVMASMSQKNNNVQKSVADNSVGDNKEGKILEPAEPVKAPGEGLETHIEDETKEVVNDSAEVPVDEAEALAEPITTTRSRATNTNTNDKQSTRKKEDSMVRKIVLIVVLSLVVCMLIFGFMFYRYIKTGLQPLDVDNKTMAQVEIPIGSSNKAIGNILEKDKIIKSGMVFTYYVKMNNLTDFRGGFYQMSPNMTLDEVALLLQQGGTAEPEELADAKIQVPEGYSIDQIGDLLAKKTKYSKEEFLALMENETFFNQLADKYPELLGSAKEAQDVRYRLEGYLFPATYNYYKEKTLEETVEQMVATTNTVMSQYYDKIAAENRTVHQVLTLSSLVEKEGVSDLDRQKIAQVFFNRINTDMPLQSDISVLYALNEHKVHLSIKDTQVESPYNLYLNKGYGPGPFNSPSEKAITAVLNPDINTGALYFLADIETGEVFYAKTLDEHLALKKEHIDDKME